MENLYILVVCRRTARSPPISRSHYKLTL